MPDPELTEPRRVSDACVRCGKVPFAKAPGALSRAVAEVRVDGVCFSCKVRELTLRLACVEADLGDPGPG